MLHLELPSAEAQSKVFSMLEVEEGDYVDLHDEVLRELVGRLCEAELELLGLSPSAAHWGGDHRAADSGLDVLITLPKGTQVTGFIPRSTTGFQVKKPDMSAAAIKKEMAPRGVVRGAIRDLARQNGAYIIVSARSSNTAPALDRRRQAMEATLHGVRNRRQLLLAFYERGKLAAWVRRHPGVAFWLAAKIGKAFVGWRPFGAWAERPRDDDSGFLMNKAPRAYLEPEGEDPLPDAAALDAIRTRLAQPGSAIRLVGLSGVGKTRFAEQLFDTKHSRTALPPSQVVYADMNDSPDPPPTAMAERLAALGKPTFVVVDNCPPDLHRSLSSICRRANSRLSVLTIEYDIREDQPEGTHVIRLEPNSDATIDELLRSRYRSLHAADIEVITRFSGGNAKLAIVAAEAWTGDGARPEISDASLFRNIFVQRNREDDSLLKTAQAASLVYSFSVDAATEGEARRLASLCSLSEADFTRHVAQLKQRGVVQARGQWRAVLPHAIANRLAVEALESWSLSAIEGVVVDRLGSRLLTSFSRRLGFLHNSEVAAKVVDGWLAPRGLLGEPETFDKARIDVLANVAPVSPWRTLAALERVATRLDDAQSSALWASHAELLRRLAYEPQMFSQATRMLTSAALQPATSEERASSARALVSLFYAALSGTHAPIEQRVAAIQSVMAMPANGAATLAVECLDAALECEHFSSSYLNTFGARSRDHGYRPRTSDETRKWFVAALGKATAMATMPVFRQALRPVIARRLGALWRLGGIEDEIAVIVAVLADGPYWAEGWKACRRAMLSRTERLGRASRERLKELEKKLAPTSLGDRVRAFLVGDYILDAMDETSGESAYERAVRRLEATCAEIAGPLLDDALTLNECLPILVTSSGHTMELGRAMARVSKNVTGLWDAIAAALTKIPEEKRQFMLPIGVLRGMAETHRPLVERLLDACIEHPVMGVAFASLQAGVGVLSSDIPRVLRAVEAARAPLRSYVAMAYGGATNGCGAKELSDLIIRLAQDSDGYQAALEILWMQLSHDRRDRAIPEPEIVRAGREVLRHLTFDSGRDQEREYRLLAVMDQCLEGPSAAEVVRETARKMKQAMRAHDLWSDHAKRLIKPLLRSAPIEVLDELLGDSSEPVEASVRRWEGFSDRVEDPWEAVPKETWREWCDRNPEARYVRAASVVEPGGRAIEGTARWSEIASHLLACAPNPEPVLDVFVERFRPMSWSGSRAAIMEGHLRLMESLDAQIVARMPEHVERGREFLRVEIARERQWEKERSRATDERFE